MSTPASPFHSASAHRAASIPDWKQELNQRLREHRLRRGAASTQPAVPAQTRAVSASTVAARVAERYREAPSYRDLLQNSGEVAPAAVPTAEAPYQAAHCDPMVASAGLPPSLPSRNPQPELARPAQTGELPLAVEHPVPLPGRPALPQRRPADRRVRALVDAFAEAVVPAAQSLPAKVIEFPRELVAPRKQRPRLAEGPLHDEQSPGVSLRIFEVNMEANRQLGMDASSDVTHREQAWVMDTEIGTGTMVGEARLSSSYEAPADMTPETDREPPRRASFARAQAPEPVRNEPEQTGWSPIELGAYPEAESAPIPSTARRPKQGYGAESAPLLHDLATVGDRLMAALVDASVVFACFLLSVLVFAACTVHLPAGNAALLGGVLLLGVLATFYGWLFMSFGGGSTPGMRYAHIALCTFGDDNPTRRQMQQRVPATALALLPLGLGVLWALLDEDMLGWQDRMTRTYQRSYRRTSQRTSR